MTSQQDPASTDRQERDAAAIGAELAAAREAADLSLRAAASELRLTATALGQLEAGLWESLGPPVYVRGYLRAYGRLVGVDLSAEIGRLDTSSVNVSDEAPVAALPPLRNARQRLLERYRRAASYALATALVAIPVAYALIHAFDGSLFGSPEAIGDEGVAASQAGREASLPLPAREGGAEPMIASMAGLTTRREPLDDANTPVFDGSFEPRTSVGDAPPVESAEEVSVMTEATVGPEADDASAVDDGPVAADQPEDASNAFELALREEVWVDIRDASGQRLLYGLQPAGSTHRFSMAAGIDARLGNADAVVARLEGEAFDLRPYTDRDVADFVLPPSDG